jgi:quinol monooxygenase YgiN
LEYINENNPCPNHLEQVTQLLTDLLAPTREEEGCCQYELYLDQNIEGLFVFQEIWASQEALDKHLQSPHIAKCFSTLEENALLEYTQIRPLRFVG